MQRTVSLIRSRAIAHAARVYMPRAAQQPQRNVTVVHQVRGLSTNKTGFFDSINNYLDERKDEKEKEAKAKQEAELLKVIVDDNFSLKLFIGFLEAQLKEAEGQQSWRSYVPLLSNKEGIAELEKAIVTLNAFPEDKQLDDTIITEEDIEEASKETGHTEDDIQESIRQFSQIKVLHQWISDRKDSTRKFGSETEEFKIPESMVELQLRMLGDRRGRQTNLTAKQMKAYYRSKRKVL